MFQNLSEKLERAFKTLKGRATISDINVAQTMKEIRKALISADVDYKTAKSFKVLYFLKLFHLHPIPIQILLQQQNKEERTLTSTGLGKQMLLQLAQRQRYQLQFPSEYQSLRQFDKLKLIQSEIDF